jgi:hypothetical protein
MIALACSVGAVDALQEGGAAPAHVLDQARLPGQRVIGFVCASVL